MYTNVTADLLCSIPTVFMSIVHVSATCCLLVALLLTEVLAADGIAGEHVGCCSLRRAISRLFLL
jgi:hypothetical protein